MKIRLNHVSGLSACHPRFSYKLYLYRISGEVDKCDKCFVYRKCVSVFFKTVTDLSVHLQNTVLSKSFSHSSILCSLNYNIGLKSALDRGGGGGQVPDKHKQLAQAHTLVLGGGGQTKESPLAVCRVRGTVCTRGVAPRLTTAARAAVGHKRLASNSRFSTQGD